MEGSNLQARWLNGGTGRMRLMLPSPQHLGSASMAAARLAPFQLACHAKTSPAQGCPCHLGLPPSCPCPAIQPGVDNEQHFLNSPALAWAPGGGHLVAAAHADLQPQRCPLPLPLQVTNQNLQSAAQAPRGHAACCTPAPTAGMGRAAIPSLAALALAALRPLCIPLLAGAGCAVLRCTLRALRPRRRGRHGCEVGVTGAWSVHRSQAEGRGGGAKGAQAGGKQPELVIHLRGATGGTGVTASKRRRRGTPSNRSHKAT